MHESGYRDLHTIFLLFIYICIHDEYNETEMCYFMFLNASGKMVIAQLH